MACSKALTSDGLVELGQAGQAATLGGDVGTVDDDAPPFRLLSLHDRYQSTI
jgi:hypothetical protein